MVVVVDAVAVVVVVVAAVVLQSLVTVVLVLESARPVPAAGCPRVQSRWKRAYYISTAVKLCRISNMSNSSTFGPPYQSFWSLHKA